MVSLKRICQAVRSMVSWTKGHVEKVLMKDDGDDQFKDWAKARPRGVSAGG